MNNYYNGYPMYPNYTARPMPNNIRTDMRGMPFGCSSAVSPMASGFGNAATAARPSLLRSLTGAAGLGSSSAGTVGAAAKSGFSFSGLLNGASKTLGVINQAIPIFYQAKPIWNNAKTMFRVAKAMNSSDKDNNNSSSSNRTNEVHNINKNANSNTNSTTSTNHDGSPTFFA